MYPFPTQVAQNCRVSILNFTTAYFTRIFWERHGYGNSMGTPRRIHVGSTWILRRYVEDQILTNFHVISTYVFDVISLVEKSMLFPRTLCDVNSMAEKSMLFPRTFFDVISMVEKSLLFSRTLFDVISLVQKSTLFPRTFFDVICLVEICTLFLLTFLDVILMGKNSTSFLVSCKLMKTFEKVFPVFLTLNSWLLQDCFL